VPSVVIAPLAALVVLGAAAGALALQRWWQRRLLGSTILGIASGAVATDQPDILYFTGENCTVCHVAQRPALRRLRSMLDDVTIREIDVARDPATARRYRVMTLPTTVVLDAGGRTIAVNAGYASEAALLDQVEAARASAMVGALA
jgi:thiol-disulfide isomerase/thioredoxin